MIRTERRILLCRILLVLNLALIWGNSLLNGSQSSQVSGGILEILMELLHIPARFKGTLHVLIRKLAHLTEFACLSALISWYLRRVNTKKVYQILLAVLLSMAVALVDETIQLYTPDRGPSLTDVWIDTLGAVLGMTAVQLGYHLKEKKRKT